MSQPKFSASFHAFRELCNLLEFLLPPGYQLTKFQADAVHECAKSLAEDLTSGEYEYTHKGREYPQPNPD